MSARREAVAEHHSVLHHLVVHELPYPPLAPLAVWVLPRVADIVLRDRLELAVRAEDRSERRELKPAETSACVRGAGDRGCESDVYQRR